MIVLRIVSIAILALLHFPSYSSSLHTINHLKEFAQEYGMNIDICSDNKVSCVEKQENECISTPQSPSTSPFVVAISLKTAKNKIQVLGSVKSKIKNESFLKYIVEAKEVNGKTGTVGNRIGKFLNYNHGDGNMCFRTFTCGSNEKQDVGMSCPDAKTSKNFEWIAPTGWKGQVQFKTTIIKSSQEFWIMSSDVVLIT